MHIPIKCAMSIDTKIIAIYLNCEDLFNTRRHWIQLDKPQPTPNCIHKCCILDDHSLLIFNTQPIKLLGKRVQCSKGCWERHSRAYFFKYAHSFDGWLEWQNYPSVNTPMNQFSRTYTLHGVWKGRFFYLGYRLG